MKPRIIAHRGAFKTKNLPENSVASLNEAIQHQYGGAEFDIQMTKDGILLIHHDSIFHKFEIEKVEYKDVENFYLSNGETLPRLKDYLLSGLENNHQTELFLEIKPSIISKQRSLEIAKKTLELVKNLKALEKVTFISFDFEILKQLIRTSPNAKVQYLNGDKSPSELKKENISGINYHYSDYQKNPEWIIEAKENNLLLNVWTVNDLETMKWAIENDFDYITTDEPEMLKLLVKSNQP